MPVTLTISAESVEEFDTFLARFARSGAAASSAIMPEIAHTPAAQEAAAAAEPAPKGNARSRKTKEAGDGATAAPAAAATEASPATAAAVDPFASPAAGEGATSSPAAESSASAETTATPAATSPADQAAADAGEVTIQQLKDAMADLLKAKSASFAMQTLEQATGCKSLTSGSPNVVEKAKDDPSIMRRTLDALVAAKSAA